MTTVYAAFRSVPDYTAPSPPLHSLHETLEGAIKALYPNESEERLRAMFTKSTYSKDTWNGPDGFGMVRLIEVEK